MLARRFATLLGAFLLIEGVWGLFSPVVFGVLSTNTLHAAIHMALGVAGIMAGRGYRIRERDYLMMVGGLLLVVGVLRFVPGVSDLIVSLLNVNVAVAYLNIAVGLVSLLIAFNASRGQPAAPPA